MHVNRKDLQLLATTRLREAKLLLDAKEYSGAYYLAGYSVECGLKACIAKNVRQYEFPDKKLAETSYTHNLKALVGVAQLENLRVEEAKTRSAFLNNWDIVEAWSERSRYEISSQEKATELVQAIADKDNGVMSWIERHW